MALTRIGSEELDFLQPADGVISETTTKRYSSEVEVLNDQGELSDVVYSGPETTIVQTKIGDQLDALGATGNTATVRSRVEVSNEDVARTTTEKLEFEF